MSAFANEFSFKTIWLINYFIQLFQFWNDLTMYLLKMDLLHFEGPHKLDNRYSLPCFMQNVSYHQHHLELFNVLSINSFTTKNPSWLDFYMQLPITYAESLDSGITTPGFADILAPDNERVNNSPMACTSQSPLTAKVQLLTFHWQYCLNWQEKGWKMSYRHLKTRAAPSTITCIW